MIALMSWLRAVGELGDESRVHLALLMEQGK